MNEKESVFADDIHPDVENQFDAADVVFQLHRIEKSIVTMNLTIAFGIGVLIALTYKAKA